MKCIYKAYILGLILLTNSAIFGMEEGLPPAKKQKVAEPQPVLSLRELSVKKIVESLKYLPYTQYMSQLNNLISQLPADLHAQVLDKTDLMKKLKALYKMFYMYGSSPQFSSFIKKFKDSTLDKAITQLIHEKKLNLSIKIFPFVRLEIIPLRKVVRLTLPYTQNVSLDPITLNNFWYISQYSLLLYFLGGPIDESDIDEYPYEIEVFGKFFGYNLKSEKRIFSRNEIMGSFDIDLAQKSMVTVVPDKKIRIYKLNTAQNSIKIPSKPSKEINFDITPSMFLKVEKIFLWPKHVIIYADIGTYNQLYLFKRLSPDKFFEKEDILDTLLVPAENTQIMVHPTKNRMIITGSSNYWAKPREIIIKELSIENDKFKIIKDLSYDLSYELDDPPSKKENVLNSYITSQFPDDNPLLWEEQRRNVKVLKVQKNIKPIFIFNDAAKAVLDDPTKQTTFFGALANLLEKEIASQPDIQPVTIPEPQELPKGPEGKEEEE